MSFGMAGGFKGKNIVFADFDGVLTSTHEVPGSYLNAGSEYGISPGCYGRLVGLCGRAGAVVVVSSNWRRFDDDGVWSYCSFGQGAYFQNPLPKLRAALGPLYAGTLPTDRHIKKSQALVLWMKAHPEFDGGFAVLDDDMREGFQDVAEYGISGRFVRTDPEWGFTDADAEKAFEHLARPVERGV